MDSTRELSLLYRIIETISYTLDLDTILQEIVHVVDSVAHADEIFLYLLRDNELGCRAAKNAVPQVWQTVRLQLGMGITGWVAQHRTPVTLSENAYHDARFHLFTNLEADRFEAFCSLPMVHHEKLVGVLNVQYKESHAFVAEEIRLYQVIATATAGAIENARIFEQAQELSEALIARKHIERAKGRIMEEFHLSEEEAYQLMQRRAMELRKSMRDVADAFLIALDQDPLGKDSSV